jgi:hypothetical protein
MSLISVGSESAARPSRVCSGSRPRPTGARTGTLERNFGDSTSHAFGVKAAAIGVVGAVGVFGVTGVFGVLGVIVPVLICLGGSKDIGRGLLGCERAERVTAEPKFLIEAAMLCTQGCKKT